MNVIRQVEKLDHVHIYVNNIENAKSFFSSLFGTSYSASIVLDDLKLRSVIDPLGLELLEPTSQDSPVARTIAKRGEGLAALSFKVVNIEKAIQDFKDKGLRLVSTLRLGSLKGKHNFTPKDSYGVMIELCEYAEQSQTALAALGKI